jgi:hypothetical protein
MPAPDVVALVRDQPWWLSWARDRIEARKQADAERQRADARAQRVAGKRKAMGLSLRPPS